MSMFKERDLKKLGTFYTDVVLSMIAEELHSKSAIAAEIAHRDAMICILEQRVYGKTEVISAKDKC